MRFLKSILPIGIGLAVVSASNSVFAHYPILDCKADSQKQLVICEASFSNRATAPNVIMEVFSEDDEVVASGQTDQQSMFEFPLPEGIYFILMDAGPGHVLEISNDEVTLL
ncbi:hypothetical protein [Vibrio fluminensis]|uniref:hypothetical protein n=1 Tax=Vibrio fluminensis TaxID=2783614 RepID=UPI001887AAA8|nr:hypothetical protein [Vibrio fluminensis]